MHLVTGKVANKNDDFIEPEIQLVTDTQEYHSDQEELKQIESALNRRHTE